MFGDVDRAARQERLVLAPLGTRWAARPHGDIRPAAVVAPMAMALSVFPVVGALPSLIDATDHRRMSDVLRAVVADDVRLEGVELVSLRRTPRCVLRYQLGPSEEDVVFGKVGTTGRVERVGRGLDALTRGLRSGSDGRARVRIPSLLAYRRALDLALYTRVPGRRPDVVGALDEIVAGAARAAVAIHTSGVAVGARRTMKGEWGRVRRSIEAVAADAPELARWLTTLAEPTIALSARSPTGAPACAHGDFTLSQLLVSGSDVGILDFDALCQAEPALDLGRFASYLRLALAKSGRGGGEAAVSQLLDAYHDAGGPRVSKDRIRMATVLSLILMAVRSWQQLKPRRLELVCGVLDTISDGTAGVWVPRISSDSAIKPEKASQPGNRSLSPEAGVPEARVYFISYPKSGRTWLRVMIGRALQELIGLDELEMLEEGRIVASDLMQPTFFTHDGSSHTVGRRWQDLDPDKSPYRGRKVVYITRDPRDVVVSCFFQSTRRKSLFAGTISDFIRSDNYGIRKIVTFNRIWHEASKVPDAFLLVRYEDLHVAPRPVLRSVLGALGVRCSDDGLLDRAIEFAAFQNMRRIEQDGLAPGRKLRPGDPQDEESFKVRRGKVGGFVDYLNPEDCAYVDRVIREFNDPFYNAEVPSFEVGQGPGDGA
jgi:hypothetical protein